MMYLRFVLFSLADIVVNLLCWSLMDWWLPLLSDSTGNLPRLLKLFQTYDANLDGIGHDGGTEPRFIAATSWLRDASGKPRNRMCRYACRVAWLYRNNAYGFGYFITGAHGPFRTFTTVQLYDPIESAAPSDRYPAQGGWSMTYATGIFGTPYFQLRWVKDRGNGKCHELNIGWKLGNSSAPRAQLVLRYTPFRTFETTPAA